MPVLEPVLNYRILLPEDCDIHQMLKKLKELEEEEPELHIVWNEQLGEIHAMLMGEVQIEILKHLIWERFHVAVEFGTGNIVYKETIAQTDPMIVISHFVFGSRSPAFPPRSNSIGFESFICTRLYRKITKKMPERCLSRKAGIMQCCLYSAQGVKPSLPSTWTFV